jgi:hypothetical protein
LWLLKFQITLINRYIDKDPNCATLSDRGSCQAMPRLRIELARYARDPSEIGKRRGPRSVGRQEGSSAKAAELAAR